MKEMLDGKSGAVVETIGAGESAGSKASEGNSNATHNLNNNICAIVFKPSDKATSEEMIPQEMKEQDQWGWWRINEIDGKNQKVPYNYIHKKVIHASSTDKGTWSCIENVLAVTYFTGDIGPAWALSEEDPYCLIDLDHCVDKSTGEVATWAAEIISRIDSYVELSHSEEGLHAIIRGKLPEGRNRGVIDDEGHKIEIYDHSRFISMTGWKLEGYPAEVKDHQALIEELQGRIRVSKGFATERPEHLGESPSLEDEKIIKLGLNEKSGKFKRLYDGDTSEYNFDDSAADQALCNKIAFYTQKPDQIDSIFRSSALIREKWERDDYRAGTINKAIQGLNAIYQPKNNMYGISFYDLTKEKKDKKGDFQFSATKAANAILDRVPFKLASWEAQEEKVSLWTCENGLWTKGGEFLIEQICDNLAGDLSRQGNITEVKRRAKNDLRKNPVEFDTGKPTLVGTKNGYVCDLITGEVRKMRAEDYISEELVLPVDYNPQAKCREIFKFYDSICSDDCSKMAMIDEDTAALDLRAWAFILMSLGLGGNGKGQRQKLRRKFFGADTIADISLKDLNNSNFVLENLFRKRILRCGETNRNEKGNEKYSTSVLKTITGDDQICADRKYKSRISYVPFAKVDIDSNEGSKFDDESRGFTRRFRRVNTPYYFTENPDPLDPTQKNLNEVLIENRISDKELSGYLNVLLERGKEIVRKKSYPSCEHLTQGYEKQVYSVDEFKNQFCVTAEVNENEHVIAEELYEAFKRWATLANASIINKNSFGRTFKSLAGCCSISKRTPEGVKKVYSGVRFDKEKYNGVIADMTKRLIEGSNGESGQCKHLSETYQRLKSDFGEDGQVFRETEILY